VIIAADINEIGRGRKVWIAESRLSTPFDSAALMAVRRSRYKPLVIRGNFVRRDDVRIRVVFAATGR